MRRWWWWRWRAMSVNAMLMIVYLHNSSHSWCKLEQKLETQLVAFYCNIHTVLLTSKSLTFGHKMSLRIWVEAVNSLQPQFPQQYWGPHYITVIRCKIHHQKWNISRPAQTSFDNAIKKVLLIVLAVIKSWAVTKATYCREEENNTCTASRKHETHMLFFHMFWKHWKTSTWGCTGEH